MLDVHRANIGLRLANHELLVLDILRGHLHVHLVSVLVRERVLPVTTDLRLLGLQLG
jgi:hypothetical protein